MKSISVDHAAKILGVSSATVRNWAKAGHIDPVAARPLSFLETSVLNLKNQIRSNEFRRLKTRANKAASETNFFPEEYANDSALIAHITKVVDYVKKEKLDVESVILLATLCLLAEKGEVVQPQSSEVFHLDAYSSWSRQSLKMVMYNWRASLKIDKSTGKYNHLKELLVQHKHEEEDYLGLLYQSMSSEGYKSEQGSYFTPTEMVVDSLIQIKRPVKTFLDPCCGTGKFLRHAAKIFDLNPENIYGFDINPIAVNIAKINMLLEYKESEFTPNVYCMDSLAELATGELFCETNDLLGNIDAIATNPPWGAYKNDVAKNRLSEAISSKETFSLFLEKSIQLLTNGGQLSFILPESILKIKTHYDIRALILNETRIKAISLLGRQFTGVFTPAIRLDLIKKSPNDTCLIEVIQDGVSSTVMQSRFKANENLIFDVQVTSDDEGLIDRIYSVEHSTLSGSAEWALGIVTGDNKKYVLDMPDLGLEPVFRGSDIYPYFLNEPTSYICFKPKHFQQVANEIYYRAPEKLIYKFISKKLVFAYDDKQRLSLNSANILIPSIPGMRIKVVLAFLNSKVFQYIFNKKFSTHKVLRGDLEKLPFPSIDNNTHDTIEKLVNIAIRDRKEPKELEGIIYQTFRLNEKDIAMITKAIEG